jgi:hypothetical protein
VWADLVEPVGEVRQGGGRERGGCRCRTRRAETRSRRKRKVAGGVLAVSRWPAECWSKAAAVVSEYWSVARSRAQQDKQTSRDNWQTGTDRLSTCTRRRLSLRPSGCVWCRPSSNGRARAWSSLGDQGAGQRLALTGLVAVCTASLGVQFLGMQGRTDGITGNWFHTAPVDRARASLPTRTATS